MATTNISLPEVMKDWVEGQTKTGRYGNASDYVRDLIREDQERKAWIAETQKLIDEGLASGVSDRSVAEILQQAQAETAARRSDEL